MDSLWTSPFFITSVLLTLAAAYYAYVHLPLQMRKTYRQSLLTLARAVETKDSGAEGHGERVARLAIAMAREMRLPAREVRRIEYAALLQDIGNVQVPHTILNKATALTEEEFEILKTHTLIGAEMVEQVNFLKETAPIIRHHHEAWDGSGYPEGLQGSDTPLGARILAVCTAYDSMVHARAYREGMGEDEALSQVRAESGSKFDPLVVGVFLRVLKKFREGDVN
ncbi:MAG: HD-GYP domain-containing protein [Armatimonadota bacterium]